jgi:Snf7
LAGALGPHASHIAATVTENQKEHLEQGSLFRDAAALQALKKRKLYESQLESVENNIMRVNEQQMMLENQRTTVETVSALSNAAKASKQTMHEMKVSLGGCC